MSAQNGTTAGRRVQRLELMLVREVARHAALQAIGRERHRSDLAATARRVEWRLLALAVVVAVVWIVAHLAAVLMAVGLLGAGRRLLHL